MQTLIVGRFATWAFAGWVVAAACFGYLFALVVVNAFPEHARQVAAGVKVVGCTAAGAAIGTAIAPGVGTAIGAGIGLVVGAIWAWASY